MTHIRKNLGDVAMLGSMLAYFCAVKYIFGMPVAPLDAIGAILLLASLVLIKHESVWGFASYIAGEAVLIVYFIGIGLYAMAAACSISIAISTASICSWLKPPKKKKSLEPSFASLPARISLAAGFIILAAAGMRHGIVRTLDFTSTYLILTGQLLLARKKVDGWAVWVAADASNIALYCLTHSYMSMFRSGLTLITEASAFFKWRREATRK
jgi:nicotinamide riboside transporter PnuC